MTDDFNFHQADVRNRVDSLSKSAFLISTVVFSVSVSYFNNGHSVSESARHLLSISWAAFILTIILIFIMTFLMVCRDYHFGEKWRNHREQRNKLDTEFDKAKLYSDYPKTDKVIWVLGVCAMVCFISALCSTFYAFDQIINP